MHKNLYKTIFSQTRGEMIVVAENVSAEGQQHNSSTGRVKIGTETISIKSLGLSVLAFSLMLATGTAMFSSSIDANVVADSNAAGNQRPTVIQSANGTIQVNIQTPTQAGVSMNHYQQFDVNQHGVILNNSRQNTQTQLGGYIQANPWLAGGEAKVIVNQVNSSNPSHLNGYVEVGGRKADVIIANQAGINVDGGGFINAGGVTLSTANSNIQNGQVMGYNIRDGQINITGNGLDTSKTDYTQILSRAASINAGVWAKDLKVVTGQNDVDASQQISAIRPSASSTGTAPQLAIDTSNLGGMYAGKISLISTEKGIGINHAGQVFSSAGNIQISANGEVLNSGAVVAQDKANPNQAMLDIQASALNNSGSLSSLAQQNIKTENIQNTGLITTSTELNIRNSSNIQNSGELNAGRVDVDTQTLTNQSGKIVQTGLQDLAIAAKTLNNKNKGMIGYTEIDQDTGAGTGSSSGSGGAGNGLNSGSGSTAPSTATGSGRTSSTDSSMATSFIQGKIKADQIENNAGKITANGGMDLTVTDQLENSATLNLNNFNINGDLFNNEHGELNAKTLQINVQHADNSMGKIYSQNATIEAKQLLNPSGVIQGQNRLNLNVENQLNNRAGHITAMNTIDITDGNRNSLTLDNTQAGKILSAGDISIQSKKLLHAEQSELAANQNIALKQTDVLTVDAKIQAGQDLTIDNQSDVVNNSALEAGQSLKLSAQNITNNNQAQIQANQQVQLLAQDKIANTGLVNSQGLTLLDAKNEIQNRGTGQIYGDHIALQTAHLLNAEQQTDTRIKAGTIAARQRLDIAGDKIENREQALISSENQLVVGGQLNQDYFAEGSAQSLDNASARIQSGGDMYLGVDTLSNRNLHFSSSVKEIPGTRKQVTEYQGDGSNEILDKSHITARGSHETIYLDGKEYEDYTRYNYTQHETKDYVDSSAPAEIISAGTLSINGQNLINDKSQILAAKGINILGSSVNNIDAEGEHRVIKEGSSRYHYVGWNSLGMSKRSKWNSSRAYNPADIVTPIKLDVVKYDGAYQGGVNSPQIESVVRENVEDKTSTEIRSITPNLSLPNQSLYNINKENNNRPLIESSDAFTHYKKWLGSDYMLQMFNFDPQNIHKRLGDGYYEQKLVNDQIAKLTGQIYLDGYSNFEDQFKALMNSGISAAKDLNLSVGVALSVAQIARLTSDMVWMVTETITVDGEKIQVLLPKVYVAVQPGDLKNTGALIAGESIHLKLAGDLNNQGSIAGRQLVNLEANNIINVGGLIQSREVFATAQTDINNIGGQIQANKTLALDAGRNINNITTTIKTENKQGLSEFSAENIGRVAGLDVQDRDGQLLAQAKNNINLTTSEIQSQGSVTINAGQDINLSTVNMSRRDLSSAGENNQILNASSRDVGTQIQATGDISLKSGVNTQIKASTLNSQSGNVVVNAGKNVQIQEGRATHEYALSAYEERGNAVSSTRKDKLIEQNENTSVSSVITGKNVVLNADKNIAVQGSQVITDELTQLQAKENIQILASEDKADNLSLNRTQKSGVMSSGGIGFSVGSLKESTEQKNQNQSITGSTIGSLNGNTNIIAGQNYQQTGSTVSAQQGDVNIVAQQVNIEAAVEKQMNDYQYEHEQKGLTLAVNVPVVSAIQTAMDATKQVGESKNDRVNAMAAANAGFDAYKAGQSIAKLKDAVGNAQNLKEAANVSVNLSYGEQKESSFSHSEGTTGGSSQVYAGGQSNIVAHAATATSCGTAEQCSADRSSGAAKQSNINIVGSDVLGKQSTTLIADYDINIKAFEQNSSEASGNKSVGFNAGLSISTQGGPQITVGANLGKGSGNGEEINYLNSHVGSQESQTVINSGNATNMTGGQVQGKVLQLTAKELNIESLQDTASYQAKQENISGQFTAGTGGGSASISASQSNIDANYASLNEQSGIYAGDDGYQIKVQNNTDLKGAIITSTQKAEDEGKNAFSTGTLTASNIYNISKYNAKGIGISTGLNLNKPKANDQNGKQQPNTVISSPGKIDEYASSQKSISKSIGFGLDSESDSSVSQSGINIKNITISDEQEQQVLTGKTAEHAKEAIYTKTTTDNAKENSGALKNNFDKDKVQGEINLQVDVTQQFDKNRQEMKQQLYAVVDQKKVEATAIRKENGGYDTDASKQLDLEADKLNEITRWVDMGLGVVWGLGDTTALTAMYLTTQADRVQRAINTPKEMWFQTCSAANEGCQSRQIFSLDDLTDEERLELQINKNVITVSNPGIFNNREDALKNASKQNITATNQAGIVVIMNPPTGRYDGGWITTSLVSELMYAGYDKFNDIIGGYLPLSNSEKLNQDLYHDAKLNAQNYFENRNPLELDLNSHSRGGLTSSVALQHLNNKQNILAIPIRQSRFDGTATHVQDYANQLFKNGYISTDGYYSSAYSAVHRSDPVGSVIAILGGNPRLHGNCFWCYSHSSYFAEIPPKFELDVNGKQTKTITKSYKDYVKKWGEVDANNPINKSAPVLIRPNIREAEDKYFNEEPY